MRAIKTDIVRCVCTGKPLGWMWSIAARELFLAEISKCWHFSENFFSLWKGEKF